MDLAMSRGRLLTLVTTLILLSFLAEKSRQLVGEERSSKSGRFSIFDCFDMRTGTLACAAKEGVKLYTYSIRAGIVEQARQRGYAAALQEALHEGVAIADATKQAQSAGKKAAKIASRKARRITGPILAAGWDFFEAIYYGGGVAEASFRAGGTLIGTWVGGLDGERRLGRLGYLMGSHVGSWLGGRVGLMVYDVGNAVYFVTSTVKGFVSGDRAKEENVVVYSAEEEGYAASNEL